MLSDMKKIQLLATLRFVQICLLAQVPQSFNYQGILRKSDGTVLPNHVAQFDFSIKNGITGDVEYVENKDLTSNAFGIITHQIGTGTPVFGEFTDITWETGNTYLRVVATVNGETIDLGWNYLNSVPYALFAERVSNDWAGTHIQNEDGSNQVHTAWDDDGIYFKTDSQYHFAMKGARLEFINSNASILIGEGAGENMSPGDWGNIFIGNETGYNSQGGYSNVAIGTNAFQKNENGAENVAIGSYTLYENLGGYGNIALGEQSLSSNTQGSQNIAIGANSLSHNSNSNSNIAIGTGALYYNEQSENTESGENIALGNFALEQNYEGAQNIAIGSQAMSGNNGGNSNSR